MPMETKKICLQLLSAESEADVQRIIENTPEMANADNWIPLDNRETNFNVTSNQASDGGKALTELMTNMVDAVLTKHAYLKNIDPRGKEAPATMYEGVDLLIKKLWGGRLINLEPNDSWLRDFAQKNLVIGITGAKTKKEGLPCYTFVDNGEGQAPENFDTTFVSLSAGNKKSIPFVQGKFNMGSSGVLRYCGRRWFKLIVSRRYDGTSPWGWTLIRRRPDVGDDLPIAEYFVLSPTSNEIPAFESDILYPFNTMSGSKYDGVSLETGTVVKLYDYQVGSKFLSFKGSREILNENLVETILPFRLLDFRQLPKSKGALEAARKRGGERAEGIDSRPFYGMEFLLLNSHREEGLEDEEDAAGQEKIFVGNVSDEELGKISISAIRLKNELPGWLKASNKRVFHTVNGQVQYKQTRGFLSQSCRFPALKDRVVVIIDSSSLKFSAHNEVWKGDREHISNTILGERYREKVTQAIKESKALKELQKEIAQQELERATKSESNALFQKLVDADRNLANLLSDRDPTIKLPAAGGASGGDAGTGEFEGLYSPTFVRLEGRINEKGIDLPIDRNRPVSALTDAENGYLNRPQNRGRILLDDDIRSRFGIREHLHDGELVLFLDPDRERVHVGETFSFRFRLKDDAMAEAVESETLTVRIVEEQKASDKSSGTGRKQSGDGESRKGKGHNAPVAGLPKCILLTSKGREVAGYETQTWPSGFSEHDGGVIEDLGDEVIYKINYDNSYHLKYRAEQRGQIAKDVVTEKYILGMRILLLGYEHALREAKNGDGHNGIAEFYDDFRCMAARGAASTVLSLAEVLPRIVDRSTALEEPD